MEDKINAKNSLFKTYRSKADAIASVIIMFGDVLKKMEPLHPELDSVRKEAILENYASTIAYIESLDWSTDE